MGTGSALAFLPESNRPELQGVGRTPALFFQSVNCGTRYFDFFTSQIRNRNTRVAYFHATNRFSQWCEARGIFDLAAVRPVDVASYVEYVAEHFSKPTAKQHLAALRALFDWMVVGQVIAVNPAHAVRGPKYVVRKGKTPLITFEEFRALLDSIETDTLIGLRDRALIATLFNSVCRITAALSMSVEDYFTQGRSCHVRLHEKGGKEHVVVANSVLEKHMDAYISGAGLAADPKSPLFRSSPGWPNVLQRRAICQSDAHAMVRRRAVAAGITTKIGNHSFRAGGITAFLMNGGRREIAQQLAAHESSDTTALYDRRPDEINRAEVERIVL
jgi:site-specific recombinase XerD